MPGPPTFRGPPTMLKAPKRMSIESSAAARRNQLDDEQDLERQTSSSFFDNHSIQAAPVLHRPVPVRPAVYMAPAPAGRARKQLDIRNFGVPGSTSWERNIAERHSTLSPQRASHDVKPDLPWGESVKKEGNELSVSSPRQMSKLYQTVPGSADNKHTAPFRHNDDITRKRRRDGSHMTSGSESGRSLKSQRLQVPLWEVKKEREEGEAQGAQVSLAPLRARQANMRDPSHCRNNQEQTRGPHLNYTKKAEKWHKHEAGLYIGALADTPHDPRGMEAYRAQRSGQPSASSLASNANIDYPTGTVLSGDRSPSFEPVRPALALTQHSNGRSTTSERPHWSKERVGSVITVPSASDISHYPSIDLERPDHTLASYVTASASPPDEPAADEYDQAYDSFSDHPDALIAACELAEQQHTTAFLAAPRRPSTPAVLGKALPGAASASETSPVASTSEAAVPDARIDETQRTGIGSAHLLAEPSIVAATSGHKLKRSRKRSRCASTVSKVDQGTVSRQQLTGVAESRKAAEAKIRPATPVRAPRASASTLIIRQAEYIDTGAGITCTSVDPRIVAQPTSLASPSALTRDANDDKKNEAPELQPLLPIHEKPPSHNGRPTWATDKSPLRKRVNPITDTDGVLHFVDNKQFQQLLEPFFDTAQKGDHLPTTAHSSTLILRSVKKIRLDDFPSAHSRAYIAKLARILVGSKASDRLFPNVNTIEFGPRASLALARLLQGTWDLCIGHAIQNVQSEVERRVESGDEEDVKLNVKDYCSKLKEEQRKGAEEAVATITRIANDFARLAMPSELVFPTETSHRLSVIFFDRYAKRCKSVQRIAIHRLQNAPLVLVPGVAHHYHMSPAGYPLTSAKQRIIWYDDDQADDGHIDEMRPEGCPNFPVTDADRLDHRQKLKGCRRSSFIAPEYVERMSNSVCDQASTIVEVDSQVAKRILKTPLVITAPTKVDEVSPGCGSNIVAFWREVGLQAERLVKANIELRRNEVDG